MKKIRFRRLAVRIFAYAIVQTIAMFFAMWWTLSVQWRYFPSVGHEDIVQYLADDIALAVGDDARFDAQVERIRAKAEIFLLDPQGHVVWTSGHVTRPDGLGTCQAVRYANHSPVDGYLCAHRDLPAPKGAATSVEVLIGRPAPSLWIWFGGDAIILVIGAVLLGRSLSRPLHRMSTVAQQFGAGHLQARVNLERSDEIGDVATAFDKMADRVNDVLRMERELLANISHELRTPLTRIRLALEFIGNGDVAVARESRRDIADDLDELERILGDVLASARLQLDDGTNYGISPLRIERVALTDVISRAAARFRKAHPNRPLDVDDVPFEDELDADPIQLRRAIDNVLANAHKYTDDPAGPVSVAYESDARLMRLRIVDRGIGISEDDQKRLFRPFFRADRSRSRATGGLGLGLLLVQRIVEAHGGTVRLESRLGQGTTVTIELPRAPESTLNF
ncbi:periplasmic sensor signal transduction histidine kinase [Labilithrix luteola]|uniref:histidine kinase n=1 Tax=Labilithrix luteola TaxID=1391654 RepID=A0A0K1Q3Z3_9BACT|nr:HAMP domain-containing sensor histidine kinase [Labilithrix luteola]AKV00449.1 periplasmic sensor signal transduction histidine kinase [Labilithrix luteola]